MTEERKSMGWGHEQVPGYVLESFSSNENLRKAKELILESDVAVFGLHGWSNFQLIQPRLKRHKLTFRYSERIYKGGIKSVSYTHLDVYKRQILRRMTNCRWI